MRCGSGHDSLKLANMHFEENGDQMLGSGKKNSHNS